MPDYTFTGPSFPQHKLNTQKLTQEIATALGTAPGLVGLSFASAPVPTLIVHVDDTILNPGAAVLNAVAAHNPEQDDTEQVAADALTELNDKIAGLPVITQILARLSALEGNS